MAADYVIQLLRTDAYVSWVSTGTTTFPVGAPSIDGPSDPQIDGPILCCGVPTGDYAPLIGEAHHFTSGGSWTEKRTSTQTLQQVGYLLPMKWEVDLVTTDTITHATSTSTVIVILSGTAPVDFTIPIPAANKSVSIGAIRPYIPA